MPASASSPSQQDSACSIVKPIESTVNGSTLSHILVVDWKFYLPDTIHDSQGISKYEAVEICWVIYDIASSEVTLKKSAYIKIDNVNLSTSQLSTLSIDPDSYEASACTLIEAIQEICTDVELYKHTGTEANLHIAAACYSSSSRAGFLTDSESKGITTEVLSSLFSYSMDLLEVFTECYPQLRDTELQNPHLLARRLLGSMYEGLTKLSGLELCQALCEIFKRMKRDGYAVNSFVKATDVQQEINRFKSGQDKMSSNEIKTLIPQRKRSSDENDGKYVIRIRGIPWNCAMDDILSFLRPALPDIKASHVHLTYDNEGRITGSGYVEMSSLQLRDTCLRELHGKNIGRRWIEVFKSTEEELRQHVLTYKPPLGLLSRSAPAREKLGILRLRGLPWSTNEYEIKKFFGDNDFNIEVNNIYLGTERYIRLTGEAWVVFPSLAEAMDARTGTHRKHIGRRYVEVFTSTLRELETMCLERIAPISPPPARRDRMSHITPYSQPSDIRMGGGNHRHGGVMPQYNSYGGVEMRDYDMPPQHPPQHIIRTSNRAPYMGRHNNTSSAMNSHSGGDVRENVNIRRVKDREFNQGFTVLRLRGLPYNATEHHITEFFKGYAMTTILPATVPIDDRPSGEAYVEFANADEAWRAASKKNGGMIEKRYIELFPASRGEFDYAADGVDPREIRRRLAASGVTR